MKLGMGDKGQGGTELWEQAVDAYGASLEERQRHLLPVQWAEAQYHLARALSALGEQEGNSEQVRLAVAAFRASLQERKADQASRDWIDTQYGLGMVLMTLGGSESGAQYFAEAGGSV